MLNRKMGGKDIQVNYTDLYDAGGKAIGTRVEVEMWKEGDGGDGGDEILLPKPRLLFQSS